MKHRRKKVMITLLHVFAISTISASFALLATVAYWTLLQPSNVLIGVDNKNALVVENESVRQGESIKVYSSICKQLPIKAQVLRHFQDELIYNLPEFTSNEKVGCTPNGYSIEIPKSLPPDTYTYKVQFIYQINPLKHVVYDVVSNKFEVKEK